MCIFCGGRCGGFGGYLIMFGLFLSTTFFYQIISLIIRIKKRTKLVLVEIF